MNGHWQTIQVAELKQAQRLVCRLLRTSRDFHFTDSRPRLGYMISFSNAIDFERDHALFSGVSYTLISNPSGQRANA